MPASTPTLSDMVKEALDRGQTLDHLAERAVDPETGKRASRGLIYDLSRGAVNRSPTVEHVRAIAAALGKPYEGAVREAAIAQWLPATRSEAQREKTLMERVERLTAETQLLREEIQRDTAGKRDGQRESA